MSDGSGFDWFQKKDTITGEADGSPRPAPKPTPKKNVWGEEQQETNFDTEGMSLEEIHDREAQEWEINKMIADQRGDDTVVIGESGEWPDGDPHEGEQMVPANMKKPKQGLPWEKPKKEDVFAGEKITPKKLDVRVLSNSKEADEIGSMTNPMKAAVGEESYDMVKSHATRSDNPMWSELDDQRGGNEFLEGLDAFVFCGIAGPPGCGKTGIIHDSLTEEEIANGAEIWHVDFDGGGRTSKHAHHDNLKNLIILNPYVYMKGKESASDQIDNMATYERTLLLCNLAVEQMEKQQAYFKEHGKMPNPYLKTFLFDGSDKWELICRLCMKISDLGLGNDAIGVATKRVTRFNWGVRKTRYAAASHCWQALMVGGVHVYTIAHMKPTYDREGNELEGQEIPGWLKESDGDMQQVVLMYVDRERDELGRLTGVEKAFAVLSKNRVSLDLPGRHTVFERAPEEKGGSKWYGWPSLKYGRFETDDAQTGANDE